MGRIRNLTIATIAGLAMALPATAQEMKFFRIGTGSAGGTYFPIGGIIANAISRSSRFAPLRRGRQLRCAGSRGNRAIHQRLCA